MAYVLAGGRGSRLLELTDWRAKPAVFFGGTVSWAEPARAYSNLYAGLTRRR